MNSLQDHLPPSNLEIEESILAGCLLFPEVCLEVMETVKDASWFYRSAHGHIFRAIKDLYDKGEPVDAGLVAAKLTEMGKLEEAGGRAYLAQLMDEPVPISVPHYARKLRDLAMLRRAIEICYGGAQACFKANGDAGEVVADLQRRILEVDNNVADSFTWMRELTEQSADRYEQIKSSDAEPGIMTGFWEFDRLIGGLRRSKLMIIGARPRIGKTSMMRNMAANMAKSGVCVGIFSIEMDKEDLDDAWNSSLTGINSMKLSTGANLSKGEWLDLTHAFQEKSEWPVIIDDTGGLHIDELKRRARRMARLGAKVIFIDQLSKIRGPGKTDFDRYTGIMDEIGTLKKQLRMPIVLLCQINRAVEKQESKKPTIADLKSTGRIEEEADIVCLLHRSYVYTRDPKFEDAAIMEVPKNRGGPEKTILLNWDAKTTTFTCKDPEPPPYGR